MAFPFGRHPIPYHHKLDTELLRFGHRDPWRIRDACENTMIVGGVGSGKSSGSGNSIARAFLKAGMGGLVLCAKSNEADRWEKLCRATGRSASLVRFDASGTHRLNIMDYTAATMGRDGFDQNLSAALLAAAEASRILKGGAGDDNSFFRDASEELLLHTLPFLKVTQSRIRLADVMQFVDSAPQTVEEAQDVDWWTQSFCGQVLKRCGDLANQGNREAERIANEHGDYWVLRFPTLGDRTRGSIVATLTSTISGLLSGKIHELLGTTTTIVPDLTQEGAILVLDLSIHEFGPVGAIAQQIIKTLWMKSIQHRSMHKRMRPVFLWVDECQYFFSEADSEFLSTSREYRACPVYITQDLPTFYTALGGDNAENEGKKIVAKFQTRIFHANTDPVTNQFASEIIGKVQKHRISRGTSSGYNAGVSGNQGHGESTSGSGGGRNVGATRGIETYDDLDIHPEYFGNELRTGGRPNWKRVDGIVIRSATRFKKSGRNRLKVTFHQNAH